VEHSPHSLLTTCFQERHPRQENLCQSVFIRAFLQILTVITTPRMHLTLATEEQLMRVNAGEEPFGPDQEIRAAPGLLDMLRQFGGSMDFSIEHMRANPETRTWWTPLWFLHLERQELIGMGGYIGPPDASGMVEFGYGIAPPFQGQGYATEAATAMTAHAFKSGVAILRAHTLAQPNASSRVLIKCGFSKVAELVDPTDGPIWRWEKAR
jgi:ribosomal-protein-alanine N-acetyltransferase